MYKFYELTCFGIVKRLSRKKYKRINKSNNLKTVRVEINFEKKRFKNQDKKTIKLFVKKGLKKSLALNIG